MINFKNNSLQLQELPKFEDTTYYPVDKAYLKVLRILYLFWGVLFLAIAVLVKYLTNTPNMLYYPIIFIISVLLLLIIIEIERGFSKKEFGVRELDIIIKRGFFVYKQTIVPYKRIQHVEVKQSVFFKIFNLYTLALYTAGSSSGDVSIAGLSQEQADKLKSQITTVADLDGNKI